MQELELKNDIFINEYSRPPNVLEDGAQNVNDSIFVISNS